MIVLRSIDTLEKEIDTLIIPVCEDAEIHDNAVALALIESAKKIKEFKGKKGEELVFYHPPEIKATRVIFYGLGKFDQIKPESLRSFAGKGIKHCLKKEITTVFFYAPSEKKMKIEITMLLEALIEGAALGNHVFDKYKKEKKQPPVKQISFCVKPDEMKKYKDLPSRIAAICDGTILARDWVSTPSNDKKPEAFAKSIETLAKKEKLAVALLGENELKQKKFGALLAVAAGSASSPRLVILEHNPKGARKTIVLVGKGITFDSGGINLKPSSGLEEMKLDMSGAAAVAATVITAAKLKYKAKLIGVIPIVENMPSGSATRPGDIVKSFDGKTIEIGNTDAEGRLILADAISFAIKKYSPHILIDMATLTGACAIALGDKIAGVFSSDDELASAIVSSGEKTYERCWRMPLPDDYKEFLKSDLADIKNMSSSKYGGAITAALFLSEFTGDTRWAHIDIAGPAYAKKGDSYCNAGGTGFGVRLLCDVLTKL